ncbi:MAG: hypothetical protein HQL52_12165 [Magnetococcales bacterium]|nr:hypothetical protein [Magnetococcales bacterium]
MMIFSFSYRSRLKAQAKRLAHGLMGAVLGMALLVGLTLSTPSLAGQHAPSGLAGDPGEVTATGSVATATVTTAKPLARVVLAVGDVRLLSASGKSSGKVTLQADLHPGDLLATGADGRFRLELPGEDLFHVGGSSLVAVESSAEGLTVNLQQGVMVAYRFPALEGRRNPGPIRTPQGRALFTSGKLAVMVDAPKRTTEVHLFDGQATWWTHDDREKRLYPKSALIVTPDSIHKATFSAKQEHRLSLKTSPETAGMTAALTAYDGGHIDQAKTLFTVVQRAFPYNALAAYYLGLIHLEHREIASAITQWRIYQEIDPVGAKKKEIDKHLTLLISQQIKKEIQEALANEEHLSQAPADPNTVAVPLFIHKGDEKFNILAKGITAMIIADLAKVPGVKVLERAKLQKLRDEIKLSQSGLVDHASSARVGRLLRAEKIVMGDYLVQ